MAYLKRTLVCPWGHGQPVQLHAENYWCVQIILTQWRVAQWRSLMWWHITSFLMSQSLILQVGLSQYKRNQESNAKISLTENQDNRIQDQEYCWNGNTKPMQMATKKSYAVKMQKPKKLQTSVWQYRLLNHQQLFLLTLKCCLASMFQQSTYQTHVYWTALGPFWNTQNNSIKY